MNRRCLEFVEPGRVEVKSAPIKKPGENQVLVKTRLSAISPGTEMLIFRGQWPDGAATDSTIKALAGPFSYPLAYGYCVVGEVVELGSGVANDWLDRRVFAFQPHESHFNISPHNLVPIPDDIENETALFLANMETAVNLLLDGRPLIGENVIVLGQGIIGLLTTALLCRFPLASLATFDKYPLRREASTRLGVQNCFDPGEPDTYERLGAVAGNGGEADLVYELTGSPESLNGALALVRFSGRVVVGSWYGTKRSELDLGSFFHRGRISLISSQVSTLAPELSGRWQKNRRLQTAWEMLRLTSPQNFITHRFTLAEALQAYSLIDRNPGETIQVVLDYQ